MRRFQVDITEVKDSGWPPWLTGLAFVFGLLIVAGGMFGSHGAPPSAQTPAAQPASATPGQQTGLTVQTAAAETAAPAEPTTAPTVDPSATETVAQSATPDTTASSARVADPAPDTNDQSGVASVPVVAAPTVACRSVVNGQLMCRDANGGWTTRPAAEDGQAFGTAATAPAGDCAAATDRFREAHGASLTRSDYRAFYQRCKVDAANRGDASPAG